MQNLKEDITQLIPTITAVEQDGICNKTKVESKNYKDPVAAEENWILGLETFVAYRSVEID